VRCGRGSPNRLRSSAPARLVFALMGGICRAQWLYICPILYLYLPCPNACWVSGESLPSRASVPSVPGFSSTSPYWIIGPRPSPKQSSRHIDGVTHPSDRPVPGGSSHSCGANRMAGAREVYFITMFSYLLVLAFSSLPSSSPAGWRSQRQESPRSLFAPSPQFPSHRQPHHLARRAFGRQSSPCRVTR